MFRKKKSDKLIKAVEALRSLVLNSSLRKKFTSQTKHEIFLADIFEVLTSPEHFTKEELFAAMSTLFVCAGSPISSLQIQADVILNKIFRLFWLKGQSQKIITLILNDLNETPQRLWKSIAVAYAKLAYYIRYARALKCRIYLRCYLNSIAVSVNRPEDGIQTSVEKTFPVIMKQLGPYLNELTVEQQNNVFEVALKNLELAGSSGRVGAIIIFELSRYHNATLEKAVRLLEKSFADVDQNQNKRKVVNLLLTLRLLWPEIVKKISTFSTVLLQSILLNVSYLLVSRVNEILVATLEVFEVLFQTSTPILKFVPNELPSSSTASEYNTPVKIAKEEGSDAPLEVSPFDSPWGSVKDVSIDDPCYQNSASDSIGDVTVFEELTAINFGLNDSFNDPLIHTALASTDDVSMLDRSFEDLTIDIDVVFNELQTSSFPVLISTIVSSRFLLNTSGCDDNLRISHKVLALKCLTKILLTNGNLIYQSSPTMIKSFSKIFEFISHSDDKLAVAAFEFFVAVQQLFFFNELKVDFSKLAGYVHILFSGGHQMRVRGTLDVLRSSSELLIVDDHIASVVLDYCVNLSWCAYFLVQCSRAELIAAINWKRISVSLRSQYQNRCLESVIELLNNDDARICSSAVAALAKFASNSMFDSRYEVLSHKSAMFEYALQLNAPLSEPCSARLEHNICYILERLSDKCLISKNETGDSIVAFVNGIDALLSTNHLTSLLNQWFAKSTLRDLRHSLVLKLLECAKTCTTWDNLIVVMRVLAILVEKKVEIDATTGQLKQLATSEVRIEMEVVLVYIRVLNLYYTVYVENMVKQKSSALPFFAPNSPSKQTNTRSSDISHLVGTNIHQAKGANYNDCHAIKSLETSMQGLYKNFMESVDVDNEHRFLDPLCGAFTGLKRNLFKFSFQELKGLVDELLLYVNKLLPFAIPQATGVFQELLKVLFGRNTVSNPCTLTSTRSFSRMFDESNVISMCISDFSLYLTKISSIDFIEETLLNQFTNAHCRNPGSGSNLTLNVVTESLRRFEKPSAYLVSTAFFSNNCSVSRCKIIEFLSILLQEGVEYSMVDPKQKIYEFVLDTVQHPPPDAFSVLANFLNFLIVLSMVDPALIKPTDLEEVVVTMYTNIASDQADVGFPCISLLLLYNMTLNVKSISSIQKMLINNFDKWMILNPVSFLQLWTLLLCCVRKDKKRVTLYNELSDEFVHLYFAHHKSISNWKNTLDADSNAIIWATNAFFTCSQDVFNPIDDVYDFIKTSINSNDASVLYSTLPVMCSLSQFEERRILLHLEALDENAVDTISTVVPHIWERLIERVCGLTHNDDLEGIQEKIIYSSQVLLYYLRSRNHTVCKIRETLPIEFDVSILKQNRFKLQKSYIYIAAVLVEAGHPDVGQILDLEGCPSADQAEHLLQLTANLFMTDAKTFFDEELLNKRLSFSSFASYLLRKPALNQKLLKCLTSEQTVSLVQLQFSYLKLHPLDGLIYTLWNSLAYCQQNGIAIPQELSNFQFSENLTFNKLLQLHMVFLHRNFLTMGVPPNDSFLSYLVNVAQNFSSESELDGLASGGLLLASKEFSVLINHFPQNRQHEFINTCITSIQRLTSEAVGAAHTTADKNGVERAQSIFDMLFDVAINLNLKVPTSTRHQLITGLFKICKEPFHLKLQNVDVEEFFLKCFAEPLVDTMLRHRRPNTFFYASLAAFFSFPQTIEKFTPDYDCLEMLEGFLLLLYKGLEKAIAPAVSINTKLWDVQVTTVTKSEIYRDDIINFFLTVQKLSWLIQRKEFVSFPDSLVVERCLKAICRLPLVTAMFVIPEVALCKSWTLKIDARTDRISVPLVNIYILEDPDVLCNFCYRTLWLGWNVRSQFENYCTSLFGVLSTTPVGNELQVNTFASEEKLHASIISVSMAVETISNLLIQSVLYPQPGNPVIGVFPTKHRESTGDRPFLESKRGRQAAAAKCQLLHNLAPTAAFKESFEKVTDDNTYGIGQSSLLYLWSMTSVLEHGSGSPDRVMQASAGLQPSVSDYMLMQSTDLDTASTLRALLDNFEHWFTKSTMPMTLRISVLKSLCFLTDFLYDTKVYTDIYKSVKRILEESGVGDAFVDGLCIFIVLKCVAVLGANALDENGHPGDTLKFVDLTVNNGLESNNIVVRQYTLQGMLYILQSFMLDELPNCLFSIKELVFNELRRLCITSDVTTKGDFICASYEQILWAISFRFLEEAIPIDDRYKTDFLGLVSKLYPDPRLSSLQKRFLTSGIESLIVHSNTYNAQLLPTILDCLSTCQLQPLHIRSTVSSYIICIYKDLYKNENKKNRSSRIVDFNRLINVIAAFSTQSIVRELSTIISFILTTTMPPVSLYDSITVLISVPGFKSNAAPPLLQAFDSAMLEIYARSLMAARRQSKLGSANLFVKHIAPRLAMISNVEYAAFLIALSLVSGTCLTDASLWSSVLQSTFSHKRQLRPTLRQLPSLLDQFVAITSEGKTITTIAAALELFSLETDDGKNFRQNRDRVKNLL